MLRQEQYRSFFDPETNIWRGYDDMLIYHKNVSLGRIILDALQRDPKKIAQISDDSGIQITNEEMSIKTIRAAIHLKNCGIKTGDIIGLVAKNTEHLAPIVFACYLLGAPINAIDPTFVKKDIAHMFNLTKPKMIFCDYDVYKLVQETVDDIQLETKFVTFRSKIDGCKYIEEFFIPLEEEKSFIAPSIGDGDKTVAVISCSSGTTGFSKGVMISHAQILQNFPKVLMLNSDDVYVNFSTLYWLSGTVSLINGTLCGCTRIITAQQFSAETFFNIVKKYKITFTVASALHIGYIINSQEFENIDISSIKQFYGVGGHIPEQFYNKLNEKLTNGKILTFYGLTEFSAIGSANASGGKKNSVGPIVPGAQLKIVDDGGNALGVNKEGEICLKSYYKFLGYCGMPDAINSILDNDNWIHSGDIGYMDEEGYLYISGRKKDIIIHRGYHVSPYEIENIILNLDGVQFVSVVGINVGAGTEFISAVIVRSRNSNITEKIIINHVKKNMGYYKQITGGVYFIDSFKRTASGKVIRKDVQDFATNQYKLKMESNTKINNICNNFENRNLHVEKR